MTASAPSQPSGRSGLGLAVREVMTPGVVTIADNATVDDAVDVLAAHWLHAVLVLGHHTGTPLAIVEQATGVSPDASVRAAVYAMSLPGVTRLLVRRGPTDQAEGVISEFDLAVKARLLRYG